MKLRNKKTGEDGRLKMCHDGDKYPLYVEIGEIRIYYHSFAEMIEAGWECCVDSAEPLIKDKKIRKAVRFKSEVLAGAIEQSVKEFIDDIAELCGEEEE